MTTDWLVDLGLTPVSEGVWRDEESGAEVSTIHTWDDVAVEFYPEGGAIRGTGVSRWVIYQDGGIRIMAYANFATPEAADRFGDAIKFAARIARGYNAQETSA